MGVKSFLRRAVKFTSRRVFQWIPGELTDGRLDRSLPVVRNGVEIFRMRDFGELSRMRARTFESKEPETIKWIEEFEFGSKLLDVGANLGIYSLFAASKGFEVIAVEPDALNFALLNENIRLNSHLHNFRLTAYPLALHDELSVSQLHVTSGDWGSALSSFGHSVDYKGEVFVPKYLQGCVGMTLDELVERTQFKPNLIKIDVDGNEYQVLAGATKTLRDPTLRSMLVELDSRQSNYESCLEILREAGFRLSWKAQVADSSHPEFQVTLNHIFTRVGP